MLSNNTRMTIFVIGISAALCHLARAEEASCRVRIGVDDNRAIAVAFANSKYNSVAEKMKEYHAAKEAGDTKRMQELEAWGQKRQRQLHRQGFGRVPVDNLLSHVKDRLPEVAQQADVDIIVWQSDFASPGTDVVDITDEIVKLFDPSDRTLRTVADLRTTPPIELDVIEQNHDH